MKKYLLLLLALILINVPALADVVPYYVSNVSSEVRGFYQASKDLTIYEQPNEKSTVLLKCNWDYKHFNCPNTSMSNLFAVFVQSKELAFMTVTDDIGDWVEVIYDRNTNKKGWIKKDVTDPYRFLNLRTFYNLYGRKYGIYVLKDAPQEINILRTSTSVDSQTSGQIDDPIKIQLQAVKGNWLLVKVIEGDKTTRTGYLQWRNTNGEIYAFPDIK